MQDVAYLRETELALMNAPFDAGGWSKAIGMVATATGSGAAHLAALGGPLLLPLDMFVGRDADKVDRYFSRPELCGAANWRITSIGAPMSIQHEGHYAQARALGGTADYDDAVADFDMALGCQSTLIHDERNFLGLALIRSRLEGPSDEVVLARFRHLLRHVQRSVRVQLALDGEAAEMLLGDMSTIHCRTVLLDRHGCLCAMTQSAEAMVEEDGPARLAGMSFELRDNRENRQMHAAMRRLLASDSTEGPQIHQMPIGRSADAPAGNMRLTIVRLPHREHGLGFDAHLAMTFRPLG